MWITNYWRWYDTGRRPSHWMIPNLRLRANLGETRWAFTFVPTSHKCHLRSLQETLLLVNNELLKVVRHGETTSSSNDTNPTFAGKSLRNKVSFHVCAYLLLTSLGSILSRRLYYMSITNYWRWYDKGKRPSHRMIPTLQWSRCRSQGHLVRGTSSNSPFSFEFYFIFMLYDWICLFWDCW